MKLINKKEVTEDEKSEIKCDWVAQLVYCVDSNYWIHISEADGSWSSDISCTSAANFFFVLEGKQLERRTQ